jgi:hypothetical protein
VNSENGRKEGPSISGINNQNLETILSFLLLVFVLRSLSFGLFLRRRGDVWYATGIACSCAIGSGSPANRGKPGKLEPGAQPLGTL